MLKNCSNQPENDLPVFCNCLYFTANSLARIITRMAEEAFSITGLSPSHAFLLMLVNARPGIAPKVIAAELNLAPSTVTRFIDKLASRGYLERIIEGKTAKIMPTQKGIQTQETIALAWQGLFERYSTLLGEEESRQLTRLIDEANQILED